MRLSPRGSPFPISGERAGNGFFAVFQGVILVSPLYTPEQLQRRDASRWTIVQGILAPIQFAIFAVSAWLVISYLLTGNGFVAATYSVVIKTAVLYAIMITGAIWEKDVYGQYLFAPAFFWEDMVSMGVLALHTLYLSLIFFDLGSPQFQMATALIAYLAYVINATQYVLKLRKARLETSGPSTKRVPA